MPDAKKDGHPEGCPPQRECPTRLSLLLQQIAVSLAALGDRWGRCSDLPTIPLHVLDRLLGAHRNAENIRQLSDEVACVFHCLHRCIANELKVDSVMLVASVVDALAVEQRVADARVEVLLDLVRPIVLGGRSDLDVGGAANESLILTELRDLIYDGLGLLLLAEACGLIPSSSRTEPSRH